MKKILAFVAIIAGVFFVSCSKEESGKGIKLILDKYSVSLHQKETVKITSNGTDVTYTSRNPNVADVEKNGEVTALFVGETVIDVKSNEGTAEFKVTVAPRYHTFIEPCHDWTKTRKEVFTMHPNLSFSLNDDHWGAMVDIDKAMIILYEFDSFDKLKSSSISISQDYAIESMYFLAERYLPIGEKNNVYYFANGLTTTTFDTIIAMSKLPGYRIYGIYYFPYTPSKSSDMIEFNIPEFCNLPECWKE